MDAPDLRGLVPACVTPFTEDGAVDHEALAAHGRWLAGIDGVKGIVCNGHAGEGASLSEAERTDVVATLVAAVEGTQPIITGVTADGSAVAGQEARRYAEAGAAAVLLYPAHGWLRFGFQRGAAADRYRIVAEESGLPQILFQYPDVTKASYGLEEQLAIAALDSVFAIKNGVRNMRRWDTEVPVLRREFPDLQILTCHDEYLLHTMFDVDGACEDPTQSLVVIVQDDERRCCLLVDELLGQQQVVIKSLGDGIGQVRGVSGGAILGDGSVSLILDVPGLIGLASAAG